MTDMSVGANIKQIPATKLCVKKNWTRDEMKKFANVTAGVTVGLLGASLLPGRGKGFLRVLAFCSGLSSLGLLHNYRDMKKNNIDEIHFVA